jgi:hypothetical protein
MTPEQRDSIGAAFADMCGTLEDMHGLAFDGQARDVSIGEVRSLHQSLSMLSDVLAGKLKVVAEILAAD